MRATRQYQHAPRRWSGARHSSAAWSWAPIIAVSLSPLTLPAAETNAPTAITPVETFEGGTNSYSNWIEFSTGGFLTHGNKVRFQQQHQTSARPFGGIEDFHYLDTINKTTTLAVDGRALFDEHDYKLSLDLEREKTGYLKVYYSQFRTWSDGNGGFYPPGGLFYARSGDALALDRREFSFEGGLTLADKPKITFKYTHTSRDGEKGSTSWGITHPDIGVSSGLGASYYDIKEHGDSFQLDVTHTIKKTDLGVGVRYDSGKLDDALKITQSPAEPAERKITDRQGTTYDMFNVHAFTETWLTKSLMFSSGFSYADLGTDFSGSRIYGSDFDVGYAPNAQNGFGYFGLNGSSRLHEYVTDLNLFYRPSPNVTIIPSLRVQKEDWDANSAGFETLADKTFTSFAGTSDRSLLDVRERLDLRYTGITNWVLYARADLTEGDGNLNENGGLVPVNGIGIPPIERKTEDRRFFQKYSIGARWYPSRGVTVDASGYYKLNDYDYDHPVDSTPNDSSSPDRYPAYLVMQNFETYDGSLRLTLRPRQNVTLVSRYELQFSTIHTKPDQTSGLQEVESSRMKTHILAQDVNWSPWSRLYVQAGFNYVLSDTKTPASEVTQAILRAQNNYWTMNFSSDLVLDNKTDLKVSYFYYQADDYSDNSAFGVPYGAGAEEHGVTASLIHRFTKRLQGTLRYGFFTNHDRTYGSHNDYTAHMVYSSLRYAF